MKIKTNIIPKGPGGKLPSGLYTTGDLTCAVATVDLTGVTLKKGDVIEICPIPANSIPLMRMSYIAAAGLGGDTALFIGDNIPYTGEDEGRPTFNKYGKATVKPQGEAAIEASASVNPQPTANQGKIQATVDKDLTAPGGQITFYIAFLMQN